MFTDDIKRIVNQYGKYTVIDAMENGEVTYVEVTNGRDEVYMKLGTYSHEVHEITPRPQKNTIRNFNACVQMAKYVEKFAKTLKGE